MSELDQEAARDAILKAFNDAWTAQAPAVNDGNGEPPVFWDNLDGGDPPAQLPWARVTVRHTDGDQVSLGGAGGRRFESVGLVTVQVFVPAGARGLALADKLAKIARGAFEGQTAGDAGQVWFRNVKTVDVGVDGAWYQQNVVAEFQYEQTK